MKRKIFLTFLASSFMVAAIVTTPLYFYNQGSSHYTTHHGEM